MLSWPEIVGERLAAVSQPLRLDWPKRQTGQTAPQPSTLVVRVEGQFAIEAQHLAPLIIERVNAFYGWRCVGRLVLKQGPVRRGKPPAKPTRPVDPADRARIGAALAGVEDAGLKKALGHLGEAVVRDRRGDGQDREPVAQSE